MTTDFDLTALAEAQRNLADLGYKSEAPTKEAFTAIPGGVPPAPPGMPPGGGGPPGMPPMGGPSPGMPPMGPPPTGGPPPGPGGGQIQIDPAMLQQLGVSPPADNTQPVSMTIDQLIKLVSAITGKGNGSKKTDRRMMQLEMLLAQNGITPPPDDDQKQEGDPQNSAIQPSDGNTAGGLMGPINPISPMKSSEKKPISPRQNIVDRLRARL